MAANAEQVILVGDTQQLPPTITSSNSNLRQILGTSPMARLENAGVRQYTLQIQYRMPQPLLDHPSKYFYDGMVQSADSVISRSATLLPPKGFPWPSKLPLAFVQAGNGDAEITHRLGGRSNPTEAKLVAKIVTGLLLGKDIRALDISILTPYSKQVQAIRTALEEESFLRAMTTLKVMTGEEIPLSSPLNGSGTQNIQSMIGDVKVGTIDSFQGQETEVVLFSAVRSNMMSNLGFLRDRRRLCVAITRSRRAMIIVGDSSVLTTCRHWQALLQSCRDRGCWVDGKMGAIMNLPNTSIANDIDQQQHNNENGEEMPCPVMRVPADVSDMYY
jgi:superfamily I DNA and/or RNA helicase